MTVVERSCTEILDGGERAQEPDSKPLSEYRSETAYVLLGDPGAGKSTCFEQECQRMPDSATLIPARDFVAFEVENHSKWRNSTLFVDGLDEIRAGDGDPRTALDRVRAQLDRLGWPSFRLSCREADWLGRNDRSRLEAGTPEGRVTVLRLDPLTPEEAEVVAADGYVKDAAGFLTQAREKGLGGLLGNPQNLTLLASAVAGGRWPGSRRELFELASRRLVLEENEEHLLAGRDRPARNELLEAAGRICALLLLSGTAGVEITPAAFEDSSLYPPAEILDPPLAGATPGCTQARARLRRLALLSRLFAVKRTGSTAQGFEPVHRHVAEFLAARYLDQRIREGLPAARVIAMIAAGDGGVVTPHRGLSAWLAVHSKQARRELIDRDPIGVGLYGDIGGFSDEDKQSLLQALIQEGRRLHAIGIRNVAAFAPLATTALEAELHDKLKTVPKTDDDQLSVEFVLRVLRHGAPIPALAASILAIVYRTEWWPRVVYSALDAYIRQSAGTDERTAKLKQLLADIQGGSVPDPDNEMAATILGELYPEAIGPSQIWGHLDRCQPTKLIGRHRVFWTRTLGAKTPDQDMPTLLDELAARRPDLELVRPGLPRGRELAEKLLARALRIHGSGLSPRRLHDWLRAPARTYQEFFELRDADGAWESTSQVRSWLEEHPDAYKGALLEGLSRSADEQDLPESVILAVEWLRNAQPPPDFGVWCLERARQAAGTRPDLARWLFEQALQRLRQSEEGLTQELVDKAAREHPLLQPAPTRPETPSELRETPRRHEIADNGYLEQRRRREREWLDVVRAEAPALEQNHGAPALLFDLASEWFQRARGRPFPLLDWLREKFGEEDDLATATHNGLRGVIERDDLPGVGEIVRLHSESRWHHLSTPFLASLEERERVDSCFVDDLTERQKRQACAFYYSVPTGRGSHPNWHCRLVERDPELVADVLLPLARADLRRGSHSVTGLSDLAHDPDHGELARLVSLHLLRGFPVRCHVRQLPNLIRLLWAALQHADRHELLAVIEKKLAGKSMTVNQRVHWLAAGVISEPDAYADRLGDFIGGKELRARQLAEFLWSESRLFRPKELPPRALEVLLRQLATAFGMYDIVDGPMDSAQTVLWHLPELIDQLATSPEPEAGAALHRLAGDEALHRWRHHLRMACDRQAVIARDSSYRRPELEAVRATLDNLAPANAADLAALAFDRLNELATTIRHANTNDWSQYWNQDSYGNLTTSKAENDCRNNLLSHLRPLLPNGVDAQPEGQYAANQRADIRLACSGFHVPIEIKKQSHRAIWRAARDQLVAKYTQDPATGGYGIFLVLWFGDGEKSPLDETGTRPSSPEELRQRLEVRLAKQLTPEQARRIAVQVIDVSRA